MFLFAEGGHHTPVIVDFVTRYLGEPVYRLQLKTTKPMWDWLFGKLLNKDAETMLGVYSPETAIGWQTVMFVIACLLTVALVWILKGKLSEDEPGGGQQTLEAGVLAIRGLVADVIGPHGMKYFPVVATFATLILVCNLMGFFPLFMAPSASLNVTFALGIFSFVYYNFIGIKENGIGAHLGHLMGPIWWIAPLIFVIELVSNFVRPMSLGLRLFGNMFADETLAATVANLAPPFTQWLVPVFLMPLALFVCFVQSFVFMLLSMVYLAEVSHAPHHDEHGHETEGEGVEGFEVPMTA
jgi:F-type H+-transporting ATPase subunit a